MTRVPLPDELMAGPWSVAAADDYGLSWRRTAAEELERPFHGVRSPRPCTTAPERAAAYFTRPRGAQFLVGAAAAELWGLPIPTRVRLRPHEPLEIGVPEARARPRGRGVAARRIRDDLVDARTLDGIRLASPALTWLTLGGRLDREEMIVVADALLAEGERYPGLVGAQPLASVEELERLADVAGKARGGRAIRGVIGDIRYRVDSPWETVLRRTLIAAGLPEPEVAYEIRDHSGAVLAVLDLAYAEARIDVEYDGSQHYADPERVLRDEQRRRLLEARGWRVITATSRDLRPDPSRFIRLVRAALAERTH